VSWLIDMTGKAYEYSTRINTVKSSAGSDKVEVDVFAVFYDRESAAAFEMIVRELLAGKAREVKNA